MDPNDAAIVPPQRSRWTRTLTCPHCHREFDYDWYPGASLSAVRLGDRRYLKCPLCGKWGTFDIYHTIVRRPGDPPASPP